MKTFRKFIAALLALGCALSLSACGQVEAVENQLFAMNSSVSLKAYGKNAEAGLKAAASVISSIDSALDPEREGSTLYNINHYGGEGVVVTGQVAEMCQTAMEVYTATEGALDLSVYPLVKAWGFVDGLYRVPSEDEIESLVKNVDFSAATLSAMTDTDSYLFTLPVGMEFSFASLGRGCAAMYAARAMQTSGVEAGIVSIGGNIQTLGDKPDGLPWIIAVQDPANPSAYACTLNLSGSHAVSTSGGYQRYFTDEKDNTWTHIIDPGDGYPADSGVLSATVVAENGIYADALSTALCVMGEDRAKDLYQDSTDFEMVLLTDDGRVLVSEGLSEAFERSGDGYTLEYVRK